MAARSNNSFKPKPLRSGKNMAEKACHVFTSTTRFGLTQAFAVLSLMSGASYLETSLPGGLPFGNALAALCLCAIAGASVTLSARGTALRSMSLVSLTAAAAWLPASIALAGNLALNFGGGRGLAWSVLSLGIGSLVLLSLVWALAATAVASLKRAGAA